MNDETPTPSRRRGRPPKVSFVTEPNTLSSEESILAPPQEPVSQVVMAAPADPAQHESPPQEATAVPSSSPTVEPPLPIVKADDVDLRENPAMAAKHSFGTISGSDSKVRGASDSYLPVEAGTPGLANPALPEQFGGTTSNVEPVLASARQTVSPPVQVGDVVQINSTRNKHLGTLFIVGDIKNHRVHGYQIGVGSKLEYFTVTEDECIVVGPMSRGQIRARKGCSSKWAAENR